MSDERFLTVDDVAERLRVHPETVRRLLRTRRLAGTQPISKRAGWRVAESEVARFLAGPPATTPANARRQVLIANALQQAERARARGDDEGAARLESIAADMQP